MPESRNGRPTSAKVGTASVSETALDPTSVAWSADLLADLDALAESLRGYLVVQVVVDDAGHRRTAIYRSAGAAQRAVQRARVRGRVAHISLCQLLPVGVVSSTLLSGGAQ